MDRKERQEVTVGTVAPCARCGRPCLIRGPHPRLDYGLAVLIPARTARGLCEECAAHWWLMSVDGFRWGLDVELLSFPAIQAALSRILGMMHPALGRLDWGRMLAQWDLPWPKDWKLPSDG